MLLALAEALGIVLPKNADQHQLLKSLTLALLDFSQPGKQWYCALMKRRRCLWRHWTVSLDASHPDLAMMLARSQMERGDTRAGLDTLQCNLPDVQENAVEHADYQGFLAALL